MIADKEMLNLIEDPYNLLSELFIEKSGDGYMKDGLQAEISYSNIRYTRAIIKHSADNVWLHKMFCRNRSFHG